jgi:hypothetical protein
VLASITYGTDPDFNTTDLAPGEHVITLTVTDGTYSQEAQVTITVKKAPVEPSEDFLSGPTLWGAIIGLVVLVVVGVVVMLLLMRRGADSSAPPPGGIPVADGQPSFPPPPPAGAGQGPGDVVVDAMGPPGGPVPQYGAPPAGGAPAPATPGAPPSATPPASAGPAAAASTAPPAPTHQAAQETGYQVPPTPGTWGEKGFRTADLKFPGPPVELPRGEGDQVASATGVFQANPDLTPITLKRMDEVIVPEAKEDKARKGTDRETEILGLTNTMLKIPGGLNRHLMGYDMWDLAEMIVDGEVSLAPNGKPTVTIGGRRYYSDPDDLRTFLTEVDGGEEEEEEPPVARGKKKRRTAEATKAGAGAEAEVSEEEKRRQTLEKLDQRLIDGDISEETYERLRKKYGGD